MARLLEIGNQPFVITKIAVTAGCVLFLLMHAHFRILRFTDGKKRVAGRRESLYGVLIAWELLLIAAIP